jgi:peptide deformylase
MPSPILLLGDPRLRQKSQEIRDVTAPEIGEVSHRLVEVLRQFQAEHGFGHGIAAPQIGILRRIIALDLGSGPRILMNPAVTAASRDSVTLWDACMCFPWLVVKVARARSVSVRFQDGTGREHRWNHLDPALSALLQHEIDHLDGILAIDRAVDRSSLVAREEYEAHQEWFEKNVDLQEFRVGYGFDQA